MITKEQTVAGAAKFLNTASQANMTQESKHSSLMAISIFLYHVGETDAGDVVNDIAHGELLPEQPKEEQLKNAA